MITGYKSIVAYNKQEDVIEKFCKTSDEFRRVGIKAEILCGSMGHLLNCISNISFVTVAAFVREPRLRTEPQPGFQLK